MCPCMLKVCVFACVHIWLCVWVCARAPVCVAGHRFSVWLQQQMAGSLWPPRELLFLRRGVPVCVHAVLVFTRHTLTHESVTVRGWAKHTVIQHVHFQRLFSGWLFKPQSSCSRKIAAIKGPHRPWSYASLGLSAKVYYCVFLCWASEA